jgi:large subunit ribosomal protein L35
MTKQKTHSGTKDRIKVTKTGKVLTRHSFGNHNLMKKSAARKRRFAGMDEVTGKQARTLKRRVGQ